MKRAAAVRHRLDRGADQPGRRAGPRRDRARRRSDPGRDRRAHGQPGDVQAVPAGGRACRCCRSTRRASAGVNEKWRSCCSRRSSASRCARTPAASGCARPCSTWRCSTSWPCPGRNEGRMIEFVDHLHEHFVDARRGAPGSLRRAHGAGRGHRDARRVDRGALPVRLPVMPPVAPMLAKPAAAIPAGQLYEPKWDGFRAIVFRDGDEVEIGSRKEKPMTRYFPDVVAAVLRAFPPRAVIDGEIVIAGARRAGLLGAAAADPSRRQPRRPLGGGDAGELHRLRPARARRRGPHRRAVRARGGRRSRGRWGGRAARPRHAAHARRARWRPTGSSASRAPGSTA